METKHAEDRHLWTENPITVSDSGKLIYELCHLHHEILTTFPYKYGFCTLNNKTAKRNRDK